MLDTLWLEIAEELGEDAVPVPATSNGTSNGISNGTLNGASNGALHPEVAHTAQMGASHGSWRDAWSEEGSSTELLPHATLAGEGSRTYPLSAGGDG